jgi:glutamate--cysteine ligase
MVPHLTTALTGPLQRLEKLILDEMTAIERWFRMQWQAHEAPIYTSVDLRNAGFKLAPVDTNLFPAGFNNLNPEFLPLAVQAVMSVVERVCPDAQRFVLVPESHTRNVFYHQNIAALRNILQRAGLSVRIGTLIPEITTATKIDLPNGDSLLLEPLKRAGNRVMVDDFNPCAVLLNNDLSGGVPDVLRDIEQVVVPPLSAGWRTRRKSKHFAAYDRVAEEFAKLIKIDPWLINPLFARCGKINFAQKTGEDCLAGYVEELLGQIREKYKQYDIGQEPFLIVKADAGTYGMGIMTVKSVDDVRNLNRRERNKMSVVKDGLQVQDVLIQEGVYTFESINEQVAEPVVYMIDHFVVGGFYRVHSNRGADENLNSPGMHFEPLAFQTDCHQPDCSGRPGDPPNRFYTYGVIARLAMLAAAHELKALEQQRTAVAA